MTRINTVRELIEMLEFYPEDAQVFLAVQPSWPFEHSISTVISTEDEETNEVRVYIGEAGQNRYLPGNAAAELGWR